VRRRRTVRLFGERVIIALQPPDATGYRHLTVWLHRSRGPAWLRLGASLRSKPERRT
jgi:hypothetical protein